MPVGAAIGGGAVASGYMGKRASDKAASASKKASKNTVAEQRRQFDLTRGDTAAYRGVGENALYQLASLFGLPGRSMETETQAPAAPPMTSLAQKFAGQSVIGGKQIDGMMTIPPGGSVRTSPTPSSVVADNFINGPMMRLASQAQGGASSPDALLKSMPGYQFRLGEQEKAMERMQAARGYSMTPRAAKEVGRYASDYASGEFGNLVESLFRLSGLGGNAVNTSASAGANAAGNIGNAYMNAGNAQAAAAMNSGAAMNNAIQGGLNNYTTLQMYNRMLPRPSTPYGGSGPAVNIGSDGWPV